MTWNPITMRRIIEQLREENRVLRLKADKWDREVMLRKMRHDRATANKAADKLADPVLASNFVTGNMGKLRAENRDRPAPAKVRVPADETEGDIA